MHLHSPTTFAHEIWSHLISPGSTVVDATCGNGHDTLYLAQIMLKENCGKVYALDIQEKALQNTKVLLRSALKETMMNRVEFICGCHSKIASYCKDCKEDVDFIVFNLGYLPGSDKIVTTVYSTTLLSLKSALDLLKKGGYLSIMCYPGHKEGFIESKTVLKWAQNLDRKYCVTKHSWINRSESAPFLLVVNKLEY